GAGARRRAPAGGPGPAPKAGGPRGHARGQPQGGGRAVSGGQRGARGTRGAAAAGPGAAALERLKRTGMTAKRRASRIAVVGLGYVGLPLAVEFGKQYETIGFDVNPKRVAQLRRGRDLTLEVTSAELKAAKRLSFSTELERLRRCRV